MSTRRARIKAIASLPVRRKNNEGKEPKNFAINSNKEEKSSEALPLTPQPEAEIQVEKSNHIDNKEGTSPSVQNQVKAVHTPTIRRTPIRTPNLVERASGTPWSVITSVSSPRRSSPLFRNASPSQKQSPAVKPTTPNHLVNDLLQKALNDFKNRPEPSKPQEDYNPPSIPESETEDTVLDGIVPLSNNKASNPINVLKNEIISEYAEVLFDPIVPLPSPSKVRPKLRPAPRFPIRRNSFQGSASESEDEKRAQLSGASTPAPQRTRHDSLAFSIQLLPPLSRDLNRVRNDSVSSMGQPAPTPQPGSPLREKTVPKSRRTEAARRAAAARRRQRAREDVQRGEMTMYDLIFYNPTTNPIVRDEEESKVVETEPQKEKEIEESVDDPPPTQDAVPVPQIKLGPNGEIILDEKSLVIEQTEEKRKLSTSIVRETSWASGGGKGRYSRARRTADWPPDETVRFYRALAAVGTDFTLMEPLFPGRNRRDLKIKFKKEERINGAQVDKALRSQTHWDGDRLEDVFTLERELAAKKRAEEKAVYQEQRRQEKLRLKAAREEGMRASRASKAIESSTSRSQPSTALTADAFINRALAEEKRTPIRKPRNSIPDVSPLDLSNTSPYATLTLLKKGTKPKKTTPTPITQAVVTPTQNLPEISKIETGSLVVLTVDDPNNKGKKMLQTYISHDEGKLTPVALPSTLLNSVMGYMNKGTPSASNVSSPQFMSPGSDMSQESIRSSVITINPSPNKRVRHNSYNITQL